MPLNELVLRTPRLDLIAASLEHVAAELHSHSAFADLLHARIPADWPPGEYDRNAQEYLRTRLASGGPTLVGWLTWYALTRGISGARECLVASAGFLGPPENNTVEIGYSVVSEARGRGYATETVQALVAHAFTHPGVGEVIAHTSHDNVASTHVLLRCGFRLVGPGTEPGSIEYRTGRTA